MFYLIALVSFVVSILATYVVRHLALRLEVVDKPDTVRHFHRRAVPLLGGLALYLTFWLVVGGLVFFHPIYGIELLASKLLATFIGSTLLMIIGVSDDVKGMHPKVRLLLTAAIVIITIIGGLTVEKLTNPFGGVFVLTDLVPFFGLASLTAFLWLMGIMYTTKIVDGLDGLATGIVAIGALIVYFLTQSAQFYQPNVALLSIIFFAACLGFLFYNFSPASIFLGESGSLFVGFILGVLSIIAGSKIATAFLVLSFPILDLARVIYLRVQNRQPVFQGDRRHLHYALLDKGFSERQVVLMFYGAATLFGVIALQLQSYGKLVVIVLLIIVALILGLKISFTPAKK